MKAAKKVVKIAKVVVMAPAFVCVVAGFGAEEIIAKSLAYATGNKFAEEAGQVAQFFREGAIDAMIDNED